MKVAMVAAVGVGLMVGLAYAQEKGASPAKPELKDTRQKASYGLGLRLGRDLKNQSVDVDPEGLTRGLRDGLSGGGQLLSDEQIVEAMQAFQQEMMTKQAAVAKAAGEKNKKEGEAFLAENKKKPGVVTLPSGLQYKVIKEGTGKSPKATDTVSTNYRGTLIDGTEFDSSYKRGTPTSFQVNQVIPGWTEALQRMKVGSKWQLFVPSELAYGERGPGDQIGPNSTLIFEVELLGVE